MCQNLRLLCRFIVNNLLIWTEKHHWKAVDWRWCISIYLLESEVLLVLPMQEKCSLSLCAIQIALSAQIVYYWNQAD